MMLSMCFFLLVIVVVSFRSFRGFITNLRLRIKAVVRQGGSERAESRNFRLYHFAAILLQIKYKKSEPLADRLQVRISRVWWSIGESNPWPLQCECSALTSSAFCTPILGFCLVVWGVSNFDRIEASIPHSFFIVLKRKNSANMSVISRWPNSFWFYTAIAGMQRSASAICIRGFS